MTHSELCLWCGEDTSFGSGKFVNRIPASRQDGIDDEYRDGFQCAECQCEKCDVCTESTLDYELTIDCDVICRDCFDDIGTNTKVMFINDIIKEYADYFGFAKGSVKPEYDGDFLELLELLRGVTYVESRGGGWAVQQGFEKEIKHD